MARLRNRRVARARACSRGARGRVRRRDRRHAADTRRPRGGGAARPSACERENDRASEPATTLPGSFAGAHDASTASAQKAAPGTVAGRAQRYVASLTLAVEDTRRALRGDAARALDRPRPRRLRRRRPLRDRRGRRRVGDAPRPVRPRRATRSRGSRRSARSSRRTSRSTTSRSRSTGWTRRSSSCGRSSPR